MTDDDPGTTNVIEELRGLSSDAAFGYRVQALFAHVLMRQGWTIREINAQGHPDIRAVVRDREVLVQVKAVLHRSVNATIELSKDDSEGIKSMGGHAGWFAVLDCVNPIQWIVIERSRAARLVGTALRLATLQANCDILLSNDCNESFFEIIAEHRAKLSNLRYSVLCARALENDGL